MLAFRGKSKERPMFWIKTFAFRYHSQFGDLENFTCTWTNKEKDDNITIIFIKLFKGTNDDTDLESNKLMAFHIYPTTYLTTFQGTHRGRHTAMTEHFLPGKTDDGPTKNSRTLHLWSSTTLKHPTCTKQST